jgi:hypothetical protein
MMAALTMPMIRLRTDNVTPFCPSSEWVLVGWLGRDDKAVGVKIGDAAFWARGVVYS